MKQRQLGLGIAAASLFAIHAPASADVWIVGNSESLDVLIYGNSSNSAELIADQAFSLSKAGWLQLWQGDSSQYGWIAVACVRRADKGVYFVFATEQPSQATAVELAQAAARRYIARSGGTLITGCGGSLNNQGQAIASRLSYAATAQAQARPPAASTPHSADGGAPAPAKGNRTQGSGALSSTPLGPFPDPILVKRGSAQVPQSGGTTTINRPNNTPPSGQNVPVTSSPRGQYPNPTLVRNAPAQPPVASDSQRIGEATLSPCLPPGPGVLPTIKPICKDDKKKSGPRVTPGTNPDNPAEQGGQGTGEARLNLCPPGQTSARNPNCRTTPDNRAPAPGDGQSRGAPPPGWQLHLEAVTVCEFVAPQSQFGNWRCLGPLQINYVNFNSPDWISKLKVAGGSTDGRNPRDLGMIGRFRVFGWNWPLSRNPDRSRDAALKMGVPEIATRLRYLCHPDGVEKGCRQQ